MGLTRRNFLVCTTCAGAGLAINGRINPATLWAETETPLLAPYLTGIRMAPSLATAYRAYRSKAASGPAVTTWVQVDLGKSVLIDVVRLFPASERQYPGLDESYAGEGFPLRFRIEASDDPSFSSPQAIVDLTQSDFPDVKENITQYAAHGVRGRYVRLTATRFRGVKPFVDVLPLGQKIADDTEFTLTVAKIAVLSDGRDVAVGCETTADDVYGNRELLSQLTRPERQDGEGIWRDNPQAVTDPATWKPVKYQAQAPRTGVILGGGVFEGAMRNNIEYLLNSYSVDQLLRQFYERAGKIAPYKGDGPEMFWEEDLAGSNAGRFLMGAGNTVRWIDHPELRGRLNAVVDGIEECRQPNGYIMAYPEDTILHNERGGYVRAWVTHGLLEAAYSGNDKALPLLRGYYDWFNRQSFLPELLRATQGGQGMIASTLVARSPVGKPADAQVIQRYYQEDAWLKGLAKRETEQVWQYPYDRPHCYLLTNIEAYADMYLLTGDTRYYDAVLGAWELYRAHWQQAGGSISIIEFLNDPPNSNSLKQLLGELCGSSFWILLSQRLQLLHPDDERYATEIEKSIYNIEMANQDGGSGLRYHTILEGKKEKSTRINTCCEGQGTRVLGSLPEYIYSIVSDGLYVNLFEPSTIRWQHDGQPVELTVKTKFPYETQVKTTVKTASPLRANFRIRVPSWAVSKMDISINGTPAGSGNPGSYVALDRKWSDEDTIAFTVPAGIRVKRYRGMDQIPGKTRYSVEYGPILLAATGSKRIDLLVDKGHGAEHLANHLEPVAGSPMHFTVRGNPGQTFMPYWLVTEEEFTCYPTIEARL